MTERQTIADKGERYMIRYTKTSDPETYDRMEGGRFLEFETSENAARKQRDRWKGVKDVRSVWIVDRRTRRLVY